MSEEIGSAELAGILRRVPPFETVVISALTFLTQPVLSAQHSLRSDSINSESAIAQAWRLGRLFNFERPKAQGKPFSYVELG